MPELFGDNSDKMESPMRHAEHVKLIFAVGSLYLHSVKIAFLFKLMMI